MVDALHPGSGLHLDTREVARFGWLPDLPDFRDLLAFPDKTVVSAAAPVLPVKVDLRERYQFVVKDQGEIGSCVAQAISSAIEYEQNIRPDDPKVSNFLENDRKFPVSRLFLYYEARKAIGLTHEDSGCHIRDGMRVAYNIGVPRETGWRYNEDTFATPPPARQYKSAPFHKITSYQSVAVNNAEVRLALSKGHPVIFGVAVYSSFFNAAHKGVVPMPGWSDQYIGGHAMLIVGYDDATRRYTVLNSWGSWGDKGYLYMPYEYIGSRSLGADYWLLRDPEYKERLHD
jgi:C1A family cysteine protease